MFAGRDRHVRFGQGSPLPATGGATPLPVCRHILAPFSTATPASRPTTQVMDVTVETRQAEMAAN